jgi:hypothetical protein
VTVLTDRAQPFVVRPSAMTSERSGVLANGVPFAVYRVTLPFNHTRAQLEISVSAAGADGLAGQGFGIDLASDKRRDHGQRRLRPDTANVLVSALL